MRGEHNPRRVEKGRGLLRALTRGQAFRAVLTADEYKKMSEVEDHMWFYRALHTRLRDFLRQGLGDTAAPRVLDAGCGTGGLLRRLEKMEPGWALSGVDLSPMACAYACKGVRADISVESLRRDRFGRRPVPSGSTLGRVKGIPSMSAAGRCGGGESASVPLALVLS
jgi:SAM-dependent methyltransferase